MSEISAQEFGEMRAQVAGLREQVGDLRKSMSDMTSAVTAMQTTMAEARGGWKTLVAVSAISGALTSAITWLLPHWRN